MGEKSRSTCDGFGSCCEITNTAVNLEVIELGRPYVANLLVMAVLLVSAIVITIRAHRMLEKHTRGMEDERSTLLTAFLRSPTVPRLDPTYLSYLHFLTIFFFFEMIFLFVPASTSGYIFQTLHLVLFSLQNAQDNFLLFYLLVPGLTCGRKDHAGSEPRNVSWDDSAYSVENSDRTASINAPAVSITNNQQDECVAITLDDQSVAIARPFGASKLQKSRAGATVSSLLHHKGNRVVITLSVCSMILVLYLSVAMVDVGSNNVQCSYCTVFLPSVHVGYLYMLFFGLYCGIWVACQIAMVRSGVYLRLFYSMKPRLLSHQLKRKDDGLGYTWYFQLQYIWFVISNSMSFWSGPKFSEKGKYRPVSTPNTWVARRAPALANWLAYLVTVYAVASLATGLLIVGIDVGFCIFCVAIAIYTGGFGVATYTTMQYEMQFQALPTRVENPVSSSSENPGEGNAWHDSQAQDGAHMLGLSMNVLESFRSRIRAAGMQSQIVYISGSEIRIQERFASGGFGEVYRGIWHGAPVAVKRLTGFESPLEIGNDMLQSLAGELDIMGRTRHPNIVLFLGFSMDRMGVPCIVSEWADNGSLHHLLHSKKYRPGSDGQTQLTWDVKKRIAIGIARGMKYLHAQNIIHRDLKPGNVLLDEGYNVKICDFGVSRLVGLSTMQTKAGTMQWTAPELLRGEPYSFSADVYSFGVTLNEMATHRLPYSAQRNPQGAYNIALATRIAHENLRDELNHDAPSGWNELVVRCWADDASSRPNFAHILQVLERL